MIQTDFCMNTIIPLVYPLIEFPLHTGEISAEARGKSINIQDQVPPLGLSSSISRAQHPFLQISHPPCLLSHLPFSPQSSPVLPSFSFSNGLFYTVSAHFSHSCLLNRLLCSLLPFYCFPIHLFSPPPFTFLPASLDSFLVSNLKHSRDN